MDDPEDRGALERAGASSPESAESPPWASPPSASSDADRGRGQRALEPRLGRPVVDTTSPGLPAGTAYARTVDTSSCLTMPTMGHDVISVSALGPSGGKADYSNYGFKYTDVSAPGGYFRDFFGTPQYRQLANEVLSAYPKALAERPASSTRTAPESRVGDRAELPGHRLRLLPVPAGNLDGLAARRGRRRADRQPLRPQAGRQGRQGSARDESRTREKILERSATDHACPVPATVDYTIVGRDRGASTRRASATPTRTTSTARAWSTRSPP